MRDLESVLISRALDDVGQAHGNDSPLNLKSHTK